MPEPMQPARARMPTIRKLGVLTGGGDAPGLNAVIRAVVKTASNADVTVIGLEDSFDGLIYPEKSRVLTPKVGAAFEPERLEGATPWWREVGLEKDTRLGLRAAPG